MKILIWGEIKNGNAYDVFRRLDYKNIFNELKLYCGANNINVGNKVWIQALISMLSSDENELFYYNKDESWDTINTKYDKIIYSAANMLSKCYIKLIEQVANIFRNSKIPVYVIAIGAQANSYNDMPSLVKETSKSVSLFMDSIYNTGGEIACRGYFTKEYLDKIAKNSAVVIGCPSLFQMGRNLKIIKNNEKLKPIFNGNAPFEKLAYKYTHSIYIDQDEFLSYTYDLNNYNIRKYLANMILSKGKEKTFLFLTKRIKVFWDMIEWKKYIENEKYNFSIGSRIHGNIMSLLSGIPAVVFTLDSRTKEMADLYNIPTINSADDYSRIDQIFYNADYDKFNANFPKLFDAYEDFLRKCGLVKNINQNNIFLNKKPPLNTDLIINKINNLYNKYRNRTIIDTIYFKFAQYFPKIAEIQELKPKPIIEEYN